MLDEREKIPPCPGAGVTSMGNNEHIGNNSSWGIINNNGDVDALVDPTLESMMFHTEVVVGGGTTTTTPPSLVHHVEQTQQPPPQQQQQQQSQPALRTGRSNEDRA